MVRYKNANESVCRETERPVQKLVLVMPVEDQETKSAWPEPRSLKENIPRSICKQTLMALATQTKDDFLDKLIQKFSNLQKLTRVLATVGFAMQKWKSYKRVHNTKSPMSQS